MDKSNSEVVFRFQRFTLVPAGRTVFSRVTCFLITTAKMQLPVLQAHVRMRSTSFEPLSSESQRQIGEFDRPVRHGGESRCASRLVRVLSKTADPGGIVQRCL